MRIKEGVYLLHGSGDLLLVGKINGGYCLNMDDCDYVYIEDEQVHSVIKAFKNHCDYLGEL
jgi:hypothetical protein